ncbi:purine nucleoside permease [Mesorhizobium sp. DCY119]|jgi:purine nucleoside permease|uniref:purine-nucleoside phosphorylase n=1 Tax=Mesorhizobium sp. DCY119 TaxID=2108445 RepID=UPI000E6C7A09|nr:purine nucleoside permease [Mesorhizobium sp. DCY119]RJG43486.1 purine nucleoside permease [Mesorhizobium sp. DCY119]
MLKMLSASSLAAIAALISATPQAKAETMTPKVLVITMFGGETKPWLEGEKLDRKIAVPGFSKEYPDVACDDKGLCVMTTAMGYANAASSVSALVYSNLFDLKQSYILIAGIAGVDPDEGTLGSAHWARYAIDGGLRHDIDPRQIAADWPSGIVALGASKPGEKPKWAAGTEVYQLDEALLQKAFALSKDVELADNDDAKAYRASYPSAPGNAAPAVSICDTVSIDTYWHGSKIAEGMGAWSTMMTDGKANYCTTQMEDNASLTALRRAADAGLLNFDRIALLRTASNFDREAPNQTPAQSLSAKSGGFGPATANAYRVGAKVAHSIIEDWDGWEKGVPNQ